MPILEKAIECNTSIDTDMVLQLGKGRLPDVIQMSPKQNRGALSNCVPSSSVPASIIPEFPLLSAEV